VSKNRFIHLVRRYVLEQKRGKADYSAQVNQLAQMYVEAVEKSGVDAWELAAQRMFAEKIIRREFGGVARDFQFTAFD